MTLRGVHRLQHVLVLQLQPAWRCRSPSAPGPGGRGARPPPSRPSGSAPGRPRGTRIDQPRSRKWRFSSPRMVGTAKVENAVPRLGVEAVDRFDQAHAGHLDQIVERLGAAASTARASRRASGMKRSISSSRAASRPISREAPKQRVLAGQMLFDSRRRGTDLGSSRLGSSHLSSPPGHSIRPCRSCSEAGLRLSRRMGTL